MSSDEIQEEEFSEYEQAFEDGSAPVSTTVEKLQGVTVWQDVRCGKCTTPLKPVFPHTVDENGNWDSLQADDALMLEISGGYGMYIDPMGNQRENKRNALLLCKDCAGWLEKEIPGVGMIIRRLSSW